MGVERAGGQDMQSETAIRDTILEGLQKLLIGKAVVDITFMNWHRASL